MYIAAFNSHEIVITGVDSPSLDAMAMDIPRDIIQKEIVCHLCENIYDENSRLPKVLICGDVGCYKCLKLIAKGSKRLKCPFCR